MQKYAVVVDKLKELSALNGISGLLGWDEVRQGTQMHALSNKRRCASGSRSIKVGRLHRLLI
jgi:hypothetical protein